MWYSKNQKYGQGQCIPTWERMIIVGMDPSLRTIWRATCVYNIIAVSLPPIRMDFMKQCAALFTFPLADPPMEGSSN